MHILGVILAALGVVLFILWRMQQAANASRDIADAADEVRGLMRGWSWRRKANTNPLDLIDDPREAAAVLMVAAAQSDAPISERERAAMLEQMVVRFGATQGQADELLARARWLAREATDPGEVMRRLYGVVSEKLGPGQRAELIEMLEAVAAADGRRDETLDGDIRRFAQRLNG